MRLASSSCSGISVMKMLIFSHHSSFIISLVSLQFLSCQGIYSLTIHPFNSLTLFYQVRETKAPGVVGAPGLEEDPVSQATVLEMRLRLQTKPAQLVGTMLIEKTFNFILIRKLSILEPLGTLPSPLQPNLLSGPDQSLFRDLR